MTLQVAAAPKGAGLDIHILMLASLISAYTFVISLFVISLLNSLHITQLECHLPWTLAKTKTNTQTNQAK